jgi:hypothetical protein
MHYNCNNDSNIQTILKETLIVNNYCGIRERVVNMQNGNYYTYLSFVQIHRF